MKKSILLIFAAALLFSTYDVASGCVCDLPLKKQTVGQVRKAVAAELNKATIVFVGQVVQLDNFKVTLKVKQMWKGSAADEITMITGAVKGTGDTLIFSDCDYRFISGETYLSYAFGSANNLITGKCSRTTTIEYAARDLAELDRIKRRESKRHKI